MTHNRFILFALICTFITPAIFPAAYPPRLARLLTGEEEPSAIVASCLHTPASITAACLALERQQSYIDNPPLVLNPNPPLDDAGRQKLWDLVTNPDVLDHFAQPPLSQSQPTSRAIKKMIKELNKLSSLDYGEYGETVLAYAVKQGYADIVSILLKTISRETLASQYSPLKIKNSHTHTILDIAIHKLANAGKSIQKREIYGKIFDELVSKYTRFESLKLMEECPICFENKCYHPSICTQCHKNMCLDCINKIQPSETSQTIEEIAPGTFAIKIHQRDLCPFCRTPLNYSLYE